MTIQLFTRADVREALGSRTDRLALVPTMGALHAGHASLIELAMRHADRVVVSIFVNPLQFGPGEDYERYPRTRDEDLALLESVGADAVFTPAPDEMYPDGRDITRVVGGPAARILEGDRRPGHFDGVLTVVHKLLSIVRPDTAVFGEKDAQQLHLIRAMVRDLELGVDILGAPIVRDTAGLALSSRNRYLDPGERERALGLSRALRAAHAAAAGGRAAAIDAARTELLAVGAEIDYIEIVDAATFLPTADSGRARILLAARIGETRLIDNAEIDLGEPA